MEQSKETPYTLEIQEVKFTETFEIDYALMETINNITKCSKCSKFQAISILTRNTYAHQQEIQV